MDKCKEEFEKWLNKEFSHMKNTNWATHYWLVWQAAWNARVPEGYIVVPREPTEKKND